MSALPVTSHAPDKEAVFVVLVFMVIVAAAPQAVKPPESPSARPLAVLLPPAFIFRLFSFTAALLSAFVPTSPPLASTILLSSPTALASPVPMEKPRLMDVFPMIALRLALFSVIRARFVAAFVTVSACSCPFSSMTLTSSCTDL